jgi:hypothetical protein
MAAIVALLIGLGIIASADQATEQVIQENQAIIGGDIMF